MTTKTTESAHRSHPGQRPVRRLAISPMTAKIAKTAYADKMAMPRANKVTACFRVRAHLRRGILASQAVHDLHRRPVGRAGVYIFENVGYALRSGSPSTWVLNELSRNTSLFP